MTPFSYLIISALIGLEKVYARAGGGGSGGGGFGGGSSFSESHSSSYSGGGGGSGSLSPWAAGIFIGIWFVIVFLMFYTAAKGRGGPKMDKVPNPLLEKAAVQDPAWDEKELRQRVSDVFMAFQKAWSTFDVESTRAFLEHAYWVKVVLILNLLKNLNRQNHLENVAIKGMSFRRIDVAGGTFTAEIYATMKDSLIKTDDGKAIYVDRSPFVEYWNFKLDNGTWILTGIDQDTAQESKKNILLSQFADSHGFFYDLDFGRLLLPDKGELFSGSRFGKSDINNHIVGYYRDKIVDFFTYEPVAKQGNTGVFTVAQAVLPQPRFHILINRKEWFSLPRPNMRKIELESPDFNRLFTVWADTRDELSSFELLHPLFMERLTRLPFELNIELIGSTLFLYTEGQADYEEMLGILSAAFDEMKM